MARSRFPWSLLGLVGCLLLAGCNNWPHNRGTTGPNVATRLPSDNPTAEQLVGILNANAHLLKSLECRDLDMDCSQDGQSAGLTGVMVCQKPRNFRLNAKVVGNVEVDMGSNQEEFWYWIKRAEPPYLYHCSYQDFARGNVRMPFPFQPDWVMEALGMAEYDPTRQYQVIPHPTTIELVEKSVTTDGKPVRKVTVFSKTQNQVQVTAHVLLDAATGKEICGAYVKELQQDRGTGAIVPHKIHLVWPAEKIQMKLKLDSIVVNGPIEGEKSARLFTRPALKDVPGYDLAHGLDTQGSPVRRVGGVVR